MFEGETVWESIGSISSLTIKVPNSYRRQNVQTRDDSWRLDGVRRGAINVYQERRSGRRANDARLEIGKSINKNIEVSYGTVYN